MDTNKPRIIRVFEALTLIFAVIAVLSPFLAIGLPLIINLFVPVLEMGSDVEITNMTIQPAEVGQSSSAYFTLTNMGNEPARLTSVSIEGVSSITLHETSITNDMATMKALPNGIVVPPNSVVVAEPGGIHAMLMGIEIPVIEGEQVAVNFTFASGITLTKIAQVTFVP